MKTKRIAKILGLGLAAALAFSLGAGIGITPASADVHEWSTITTPSWEDYVILPDSDIQDYAIDGDDGNTVYAVTGQPVTGAGEIFEDGGSVTLPSGYTESGRSVAELSITPIGDAAGYVLPLLGSGLTLNDIDTLCWNHNEDRSSLT